VGAVARSAAGARLHGHLAIRLLLLALLGLIALSRPETIGRLADRFIFHRIEPASSKAEPAAGTDPSRPSE